MGSKANQKTSITFHSGLMTIGGTVIEVAYGDDRIFFDFGTEYHPEINLPNEELPTLLDVGFIPAIDIYDPRLTTQKQETKFKNTAVFLSHVHLDHTKMINYLDPKIPLYTLESTKDLLESLNRNGTFLLPSPYIEGNTRMIKTIAPDQDIHIGEITIRLFPVDHDAYGAAAFLIETPTALIAYSGDLRLHGFDRHLTEEFCEAAQKVDVLMLEGVNISFPEKEKKHVTSPDSERGLTEQLVKLIQENENRQLTFNFYPANIKRWEALIDASPRQVVVEAEMALLLQKVAKREVPYYYAEKKERIDTLDPQLEYSYDTLLADSTDYFWQFVGKVDSLQKGGLYIHSDAQPLGEFDPQYAIFRASFEKQQVEFKQLSLSGHAKPADLAEIIDRIKPAMLVPIHTLKPESMHNPYGSRVLVQRGETIQL